MDTIDNTEFNFEAILKKAMVSGKSIVETEAEKDDLKHSQDTASVAVKAPISKPVEEAVKITQSARRTQTKAEIDAKKRGQSGEIGFAAEEFPAVSRPVTPESRMYRPRGAMAEVFYDRRDVVGMSGPAGTGKSRGLLEKLHLCAEKYPGCRLAICRKTRESLTESALFTYEDKVLPPGHPALVGPKRSHRQSYVYPNGSVINICGLDKPQKLMSTEYDMIYVQEAIECDDIDFELITTRLRNGVLPFQQLLFDCNPDSPNHWLYQKCLKGEYHLLDTRHEDNPLWFEEAPDTISEANYDWPHLSVDGRVGRWTERGNKYIAKLDALVGARKQRLRHGLWTSAEGQIYDRWENNVHTRDRFDIIKSRGYFLWVIDFGFTDPFVCQMWWIDDDGRAVMWKEIYMTQRLVEDHAAKALETIGWGYSEDIGHYPLDGKEQWPLPSEIISDHDAEGRATFEKKVGLKTTKATKAIIEGIDAVKSRMKLDITGRPRVSFMRDACVEKDQHLIDTMQPTCSQDEITAYIWDTKEGRRKGEQPIAKYNHGMDCLRYLVCHLDGVMGNLGIGAKDIAMATAADDQAMIRVIAKKTELLDSRRESRRDRVEKRRRNGTSDRWQ